MEKKFSESENIPAKKNQFEKEFDFIGEMEDYFSSQEKLNHYEDCLSKKAQEIAEYFLCDRFTDFCSEIKMILAKNRNRFHFTENRFEFKSPEDQKSILSEITKLFTKGAFAQPEILELMLAESTQNKNMRGE